MIWKKAPFLLSFLLGGEGRAGQEAENCKQYTQQKRQKRTKIRRIQLFPKNQRKKNI